MARTATAAQSKKKPADFKRLKRKVGRRIAPAANVTSVGITSRRINLMEQSILLDKMGAAQLTHRRQTLSELLQQAGHYSAHVRQHALQGIKELANQATAANLRANASVLLERFLPSLQDDEAIVREAAVQAWKAMLPVLGNKLVPFATLVATYLCSGLTHLQVGVRQDALKSIGELVDAVPELLRDDAGQEVVARLLESFKDLIGAAETQGIRMRNTYDVLLAADTSRKSGSNRQSQKRLKKLKLPSGALALRFAALKILRKLVLSICIKRSNQRAATTSSGSVLTTRTLLLFPGSQFHTTRKSADIPNATVEDTTTESWKIKLKLLLPALLELWLECVDGSIDALSDVHVEHMIYIVECTTAVISANADGLIESVNGIGQMEFYQTAVKLREVLLAPECFPMEPSASATLADGCGMLSKWHGMNAALAKLACVYLRIPSLLPSLDKETPLKDLLSQRVCSYVVATLTQYKQNPELRAVVSMQNVLRPLLEVVTLILALASEHIEDIDKKAGERSMLLDAVTQFYVLCTPKSVSFRSCTAFVVEQLEIVHCGKHRRRYKLAWPMVMQWVVCLADLLGQLDRQHMEMGRRSLLALISVLKQLPVAFASGDQMDGVLTSLSAFFDLAALPSSTMTEDEKQRMLARTRFDTINAADQLAFAALVYHLPRYPVSLLRALASCCKSSRINTEAKSFLVDIVFQRHEVIDLAHLTSFLVSTALAPVETEVVQQRQQLQLVNHVCRTFTAMNLGASLAKILAPTLAKAQAREDLNVTELHTLVLLYRTCLSSATSAITVQRSDIPIEMEREVENLCLQILTTHTASDFTTTPEEMDTREQERSLVEACVSLLNLSELNIFASFLQQLLAPQQQKSFLARRLLVLQALVRTSSLAETFQRYLNHVEKLVLAVSDECSGEEDVAQLVRQLRGDLDLIAVGQRGNEG